MRFAAAVGAALLLALAFPLVLDLSSAAGLRRLLFGLDGFEASFELEKVSGDVLLDDIATKRRIKRDNRSFRL